MKSTIKTLEYFVLFVCLFVCLKFFVHSRIFYSLGDVTSAGKGVQIFTFARHLWPLSSDGSLATLLWHGTSLYNGAVTTCFNDLGLSRLGFEHPNFRLRGELSNPLRHRRTTLFELLQLIVCMSRQMNNLLIYVDSNLHCSRFWNLSLIHIWRCRRYAVCRSRWSPYH